MNTKNINALLAISGLTVLAIAAYFLFRSKKEYKEENKERTVNNNPTQNGTLTTGTLKIVENNIDLTKSVTDRPGSGLSVT